MKLWLSQLWTQFLQLRKEAWKIQDFMGFQCSRKEWINDEMIYETDHIYELRI